MELKDDCRYDNVDIFDGGSRDATKQTYCGTNNPGKCPTTTAHFIQFQFGKLRCRLSLTIEILWGCILLQLSFSCLPSNLFRTSHFHKTIGGYTHNVSGTYIQHNGSDTVSLMKNVRTVKKSEIDANVMLSMLLNAVTVTRYVP